MSEEDLHILKLLEDIELYANRTIERLDKETQDSFTDFDSFDVQDTIARRFTIIGEAAAVLLKRHPDFCEAHPDMPLREVRGMRNLLVHDYAGTDWGVIWIAATEHLPKLLATISPLITEYKKRLN